MKKALFLDRDGVINAEYNYVHTCESFHFMDGIFELCKAAQELGYLLVVVTNQAGIGRGYYTETEFLELTDWMIRQFAERQIQLARVYYCPYHPVHGLGEYKRDSEDRKPNPGLLFRASEDFGIDLAASVLIGDNLSDIRAGFQAGVGRTILLRSPQADSPPPDVHCEVAVSLDEIRQRLFSGN